MFKKTKRASKIFLLLLLGLGLFYIGYIQDRHIRRYKLLVKEHSQKAPKIEQQQVRYGCAKDLYKVEGSIRHHYHITAPSSTLLLMPKEKSFQLIEHLKELKCEVTDSPSEAKELFAKEGAYYYDQQKLIAEDVSLTINGATKLRGHASSAAFELAKDSPLFFAEDFVAHVE